MGCSWCPPRIHTRVSIFKQQISHVPTTHTTQPIFYKQIPCHWHLNSWPSSVSSAFQRNTMLSCSKKVRNCKFNRDDMLVLLGLNLPSYQKCLPCALHILFTCSYSCSLLYQTNEALTHGPATRATIHLSNPCTYVHTHTYRGRKQASP